MNKPCLMCGALSPKPRCNACSKRYSRLKTKARPTRSSVGYNSEWNRLSRILRAAQPWCSQCRATTNLTVDHIIPLSKGGATIPSNLQILCRRCNSAKGNRTSGTSA